MSSRKLTALFVDQVKERGVYPDSEVPGLRLRVERTGSKRWVLRVSIKGQRQDIGLGSAKEVGVREARDAAIELRKAARQGGDPVAQRRAERAGVISFEAAAEEVYQGRLEVWSNQKHRGQWIKTLRTYAFPVIGKMPVGDIQPADVLKVLKPIWLAKPVTARRVRQRIRTVLAWAVPAGHRSPLLVNAADAVEEALEPQDEMDNPHPAVPWKEVPPFAAAVRNSDSGGAAVRLALEFLLLTAARSGEVRLAPWSEIDMARGVWTVPAARMKKRKKTKRPHQVPLADRAMAILQECRKRWPDSGFIFPGRDPGRPLDPGTLVELMRRVGRAEVIHGLRSSFRDWAADNRWREDLAEAALSHQVKSRVKRAYLRTDLYEARRPMMDAWAAFVCGLPLPTVRNLPADLVQAEMAEA
jgi:integrase